MYNISYRWWRKTDAAFKNCAQFLVCRTDINDIFVDRANHIHIAMPT